MTHGGIRDTMKPSEEKKHRKVFHINVKNFLFGEVVNIDAILQENRPDFSERFDV